MKLPISGMLNGNHFRWGLNWFPLKLFQVVMEQTAESDLAQASMYEIFNLLIYHRAMPDKAEKIKLFEKRSWIAGSFTSYDFNGMFMVIQHADLPEAIPFLFKYNEGICLSFEQIMYCFGKGDRLPENFIQNWVSETRLVQMVANEDCQKYGYLPYANDAFMLILDNSLP